MRRFVDEALPLGKEALPACLGDAGIAPDEVEVFAVVSCTGYATPGVDILLARDLAMPASVERLHVGHMGCYAALPALAAVADAAVRATRSACSCAWSSRACTSNPPPTTWTRSSPTPSSLMLPPLSPSIPPTLVSRWSAGRVH